MNKKTEKSKLIFIVTTAIFAAIVFVSNWLYIPIPVAIGSMTKIHIANGICILSGLILGPLGGGLSAGIGSGLYDLTNPAYISSAPFTFVFKFLMAFVAGLIFHKAKFIKIDNLKIIMGSLLGQIVYIVLYLTKTYIQGILEGNAHGAMVPVMISKLGVSCINAVIAIVIAVVLYKLVKKALDKTKLMD